MRKKYCHEEHEMKSYQEKYIWIIGASSGIGEALARELDSQGAHLILSARNQKKLENIATTLKGNHTVLPCDVGNAENLIETAKSIQNLDSVIFLAAIYTPVNLPAENEIEFVNNALMINLGGAFNTVHAVLPIFKKQGYGHIALCGSVAGYRGLPYGQPYCATKAAIINYAESLKIELEDDNIHIQVINPGFVKTPLTDQNDFAMPMIMEVEAAAKALVRGLKSNAFEIHFPKRFTFIMKAIGILPRFLYFPLSRLMKKQNH